ncbi:MAG: indolepyruvate ferredoxin oxidoreductase family protein [Armatimonadota bacterium]|nr:indolepyruvate ferredoxin oxidoreductase family protein [Armatimonadota bacterium]
MPAQTTREISLDDRYLLEEGRVYLRGIQALVRLPLDQHRRDRAAGLRIGTFISGYPGAPLAGYDLALQRIRHLLAEHDIVHVPAANEDLAATAIMGTQMLDRYPSSRYDGVVALWYGKGPGLDRSGDAIKHGNFAGTSRHGAVVLLVGEDHEAKSSSFPFQDDYALVSAGIPILYPASVREFLELGLHAIAMSRYSGCWVALKLVGALCDGGETVELAPGRPTIVTPTLEIDGRPYQKVADFSFFGTRNIEIERHLYYERHLAVRAYARANRLDVVEVTGPEDRVGIITAGKSHADTWQALLDMGLDDEELRRWGIRLLRMGLIYPVDGERIRAFAAGLREIIVIEEKRGFLEAQVKEALAGLPGPVTIVGKFDETGAPLFPIHGGMDSDIIAERLGPRLLRYAPAHAGIRRRLDALAAIRTRRYAAHPARTPNYCSGCPHNVTTQLLDGQVAWGSPGCHAFASVIEQPHRRIEAMTQYGGEGAPWIGLQPFTDRPHMVQNMGDGSLFHSGYLAIRFAAAVGANITYKILYNGAVANTGAQAPVGQRSIPALTQLLAREGVRAIALVTKRPRAYRRAGLSPITRVYPVDAFDHALRTLSETKGTTVLIYDEMCANERRRQQKRGLLPAPHRFVVINEAVCENCGHCGALTNCMSLQKVDTEFGPKTQVHQSSCNQDYRCLGGDCPSFVTVETRPGEGLRRPTPPVLEAEAIPEPVHKVGLERPYHIYIPGVGGTGVITVNNVLSFAGLMDGVHVIGYDQTGAAQKWGPVLSSLVLARPGQRVAASKVGAGKADLYLGLDLMGAATPGNLDRCDPARTVAVLNTTLLPSGEMVRNVWFAVDAEAMVQSVAQVTRATDNVLVEGRRYAEALFGDYMMTNFFVVGVAYQAGLVPLSARSIEAAIRLNGVQVEQNLQAFRYGRLFVAEPARVRRLVEPPARTYEEERAAALARLGARNGRTTPAAAAYIALLDRCAHLDPESRRMLAIRIAELIDYQHPRYAEQYVDVVLRVAAREQAVRPGGTALTRAVIFHLFKLMAYKDEYEVARLYLTPAFRAQIARLVAHPRRVVFHFHPPLLRALGLRRKLALGPWVLPLLRLLRAMRRLRGTPFDPFGYARVRREERRLIAWYRELLEQALAQLTPETYPVAVEIAQLPDRIRGYEAIKLENVAAATRQAAQLLERLARRRMPA